VRHITFLVRPSPNCFGLLGQPAPIGWVSSKYLLRLRRASKNQEPTATEMHDTPKAARPPVAPKRLVLHSFSDGGSGGGNIGLTILATSLGFVLVQLDVSIVYIALAKIGADLRYRSGRITMDRRFLRPVVLFWREAHSRPARRRSLSPIISVISATARMSKTLPYFTAGCLDISCTA